MLPLRYQIFDLYARLGLTTGLLPIIRFGTTSEEQGLSSVVELEAIPYSRLTFLGQLREIGLSQLNTLSSQIVSLPLSSASSTPLTLTSSLFPFLVLGDNSKPTLFQLSDILPEVLILTLLVKNPDFLNFSGTRNTFLI